MFTDFKMHSDFNVLHGDSDALNSTIIIGTWLEGVLGEAVTAYSKL
jgi:hypothetical protein